MAWQVKQNMTGRAIAVFTLLIVACSLSGVSHAQQQADLILSGPSSLGTVITARDDAGNVVALLVESVKPDPLDTQGELSLYGLRVKLSGDQGWRDLCKPDSSGETGAIPLSGHWDEHGNHVASGEVTFACTSGVLAKCVRWGYKPWKTVDGRSLRGFHQACTRMARADYCGNGIGHTRDGTPINLYDRLGIQQRDPADDMRFEAAWAPQGAVALHRTRWPGTLDKLRRECPQKIKRILTDRIPDQETIGQDYPDALIFNDSLAR